MIRTQVFLTRDIKKLIELFAKHEHNPEAQVVRELLEIGIEQKEAPQETAGEALLRLAKLGKDLKIHAPPDASMRIDDYLYGDAE